MAFAGNTLTDLQTGDTGTHSGHFAHIFMADGHGGLDVQLGPGIPVVDVHVGAADGCLVNLDQDFAGAGDRNGDLPQFQTGACHGLDNGVHKLLHVNSSKYIVLENGVQNYLTIY